MKMKKFMIIASVVCMSLSGLVACSSDKNTDGAADEVTEENTDGAADEVTEENTDGAADENTMDESNLSEEEQKYIEAAELYESGNNKLEAEDFQGALNDFIDADVLVDELIQINELEEYTAFKAQLELSIEEAGSKLKDAE